MKTTLAKSRVEVALPGSWTLLAGQSDEGAGLVAFGADEESGETATAFLDGSQMVRVPASSAQATTEALARDACVKATDCTVLGSETLPGGYLVSVRTPQAVVVESWRATPQDRAVRCGFEMSALHAPTQHRARWLDDPDAVATARRRGENICRSVKATP